MSAQLRVSLSAEEMMDSRLDGKESSASSVDKKKTFNNNQMEGYSVSKMIKRVRTISSAYLLHWAKRTQTTYFHVPK